MKPPGIGWIYLGKNIKYQKALNLQNYLVAMKKQSSSDLNPVFSTSGGPSNSATHLQIPDILLLLEHSPTYTSGRRGPLQSTNHTLEMQESDSRAIQEQLNKFQELGADYIQVD